MGLRDIGDTLPPGFRFYPSDEELVCHYLRKKISNEQVSKGTLVEIDLHTCEPWQLPEVAKLNSEEWYFFSFRDRKYATGFRTNRATTSGYWKATGKDRVVVDPVTRGAVGMRKTLVFYMNRAPNGIKTGWIMHEFRLENPNTPPKEDWVLCRVFHKAKSESIIISHSRFSPPPPETTRSYWSSGGGGGATTVVLSCSSPPPSLAATTSSAYDLLHHRHASSRIVSTSQGPQDDADYDHIQSNKFPTNTLLNNYMHLSHQELIKNEESRDGGDEMKRVQGHHHHHHEDEFGFLVDMGLFQEPNLLRVDDDTAENIRFDQLYHI